VTTFDRLQASLSDRYVIERELGRGGMATVFLARDIRHDREVAIKVLHPDLSATIGTERFEREIRMAAKLQHPHILGLYDSGSTGELLFYVMPFVNGESLRDRLTREKQLPVDDAVQIVLEVADALGYAHSHDIIHRDIKPENILLASGHALVADFGIARARTEAGQHKLTQTGMAVGTPMYMSPEQSTGESVGPTADIYSLGCVLYELLAGEPPFTGPSAMAIMAKHAMETVPSVRIVRPSVAEEVEEAILAAMEKSPADRPKSAKDFAAILGSPLGATAARRVTSRYTATRRIPSGPQPALPVPWWRRPPLVAAAGIGLVAISLGAYTLLSGKSNGPVADEQLNRVAVLYFNDASSDGGLKDVADRLTEALIRDLERIPDLKVVSRAGVTPFRNRNIAHDSIARALNAGTLVAGSVVPEGQNVKVNLSLEDASGTEFGQRANVIIPRDSLFAAEESVAGKVAELLRTLLGPEIELRNTLAGTRVIAAWTSYNRAEKLRKDAARQAGASRDSALATLTLADSLVRQAQQADPKWADPIALEVDVALQRGRLYNPQKAEERPERARWFQQALDASERLVKMEPNGRAFALRGTVKYAQWGLALTTDPAKRANELTAAIADLENAVKLEPSLASAYATLSSVYYDRKDRFSALQNARRAYEADAYLSNAEFILNRLFWTSSDTDNFAEARRWCDEGRRRFPANYLFALCQLWSLLPSDAKPDIPRAWILAAQVESLAPPVAKAFQSRKAQMIVGGVIGRAGKAAGGQKALMDSANSVLVRARADREIDTEGELPGYEAIMRTQMGELEQGLEMLKQYVATHPDHFFLVGGNIHWWWRPLQALPGFQTLKANAR
jgi:serine/threonine protein kinase/tetratricopeptide (TPR) repeat protein